MLNVTFDPTFIEECVFLYVKVLERKGTRDLPTFFYNGRENLYSIDTTSEREKAFLSFNEEMFSKTGLRSFFSNVFSEYSLLEAAGAHICVRRVWEKKREGSELYCEGARKTVLLTFQSNRVEDLPFLETYLRHELLHISDMMDPAFAYDPHPALGTESELEEHLTRDRFRILWNLYVDARLCSENKRPMKTLESHRKDFNRAFFPLNDQEREETFQKMISRRGLTQSELIGWAKDERLRLTIGQGGILCPLCRFTCFERMDNWLGERKAIAQAIRADYPDWDDSKGVCRQCFDLYCSKVRAA